MKRRTATFTAYGDDGRNHTIHEYTDFINIGSLGDDSNEVVTGTKELKTSTGMDVIRIEPGVFKVVVTGAILRADRKI